MQDPFTLDMPLLQFSQNNKTVDWTVRNAVEGVQIFGGIGSGKSSGSGRFLALKYLQAGFGGLVLTVKQDEKELWEEYCRISGRIDDLLVVEPGQNNYFNFLDFEYQSAANGSAMTDNVMQVLKTVIRASEEKSSGKSDDPFWETALDMLIYHVIDLCRLAYGNLSVDHMYYIVQSLPKNIETAKSVRSAIENDFSERIKDEKLNPYERALRKAYQNIKLQIYEWESKQDREEMQELRDHNLYEDRVVEMIPDARLFNLVEEFFNESFASLGEKTRSIIDFSFSGFLFRLLRDPIYSIFCKNPSTFTPNDCLNGKIILINLPVKLYTKVGRDCQIMFKYIWQRAMEKRNVKNNPRPVFLWADEAQHFLHEHDSEYQATARSSRITTVYISQNLPNYYANMGGVKADHRVKSFLGTLATKIFHANADIETNNYASELIGDNSFETTIQTTNDSGQPIIKKEISTVRIAKPEKFIRLKTGGEQNGYNVNAYVHVQGSLLAESQNVNIKTFNQNYKL